MKRFPACMAVGAMLLASGPAVAAISGPATVTEGDSYSLTWSFPGTTRLRLSPATGGSATSIWPGSSATFTNAQTGTYTYIEELCVTLFGAQSCASVDTHAVTVNARTPAPAPTSTPTPVPTGLNVPSTNDTGRYSAMWNASPGATRYQLQERISSGGWRTVHNRPATRKSFSGKGSATYHYRVRACAASCSGWSGTDSVRLVRASGTPGPVPEPLWVPVAGSNGTTMMVAVAPLPPPRPPAPGRARVPGASTDGAVTVTWDAVAGATSYQVEQYNEADGRWRRVHVTSGAGWRVSGLDSGTYRYRVRACNASGCGAPSVAGRVRVSLPVMPGRPGPNTPPAPLVASAPPVDRLSDEVGVIAGTFRVDESGASTYSIPILTAPGIAGVTPAISLDYSSRGGNGPLGQGWSIGGLSAITRCRQTIETDGAARPIALNAHDRYCLGGARLVRVGGSGRDIEYRTEIDQFAKVTGYGASSGNPAYFRVWRKDGSVSEYGNTADSRREAPGTRVGYSYGQNAFADNMGNTIRFSYVETPSTGEHLIRRVTYADGAGEIVFNYEARPDVRTVYSAGSRFESSRRLADIVSRNDGLELRTYTLSYQTAPHRGVSQLVAISECHGATCYPGTTFTWANPDQGVTGAPAVRHSDGFLGGRAADLDGDGVNELVFLTASEGGRPYLKYFYRDSGGVWRLHTFRQVASDDVLNSWTIIDYDNDGRQDLMYQRAGGWWVRRGRAGGTPVLGPPEGPVATGARNARHTVVADIHGDGLPDVVFWDAGSAVMKAQKLGHAPGGSVGYGAATRLTGIDSCLAAHCGFSAIQNVKPVVADFNGDGRADFLLNTLENDLGPVERRGRSIDREYWTAYVSAGPGYRVYAQLPPDIDDAKLRVADINGDGLADVAYQGAGDEWWYRLNTGSGFAAAVSLGSYTGPGASRNRFLDVDRDGDADFIYPAGSVWYARKWRGDRFGPASATAYPAKYARSSSPKYWVTVFGDFDGDGKVESFTGDSRDHGTNSTLVTSSIGAHAAEHVITGITNGFGARTTVTYQSVTDPAAGRLYARGTGARALAHGSPVFDVNAPMWVVAGVESSAPSAGSVPGRVDPGATSSVSYRYGGYRLQAGGRGGLGFQTVTSIDDQTRIETTTTYSQKFPYIGRPLETTVKAGGDVLSRASNTWRDHNAAGPNHQPFLAVAVEQTYRTDTTRPATGAFTTGGLLSTTTTTTTLHPRDGAYGDVGSIHVRVAAGGDTWDTTTVNTYHAPDPVAWHTGRLAGVTVTHDRSDNADSPVTRVSRFGYAASGLLNSEVVEPGGARALTLTTRYTHDAHGNVTATKRTGYRGVRLPGETEPVTVDRIGRTVFDSAGRYTTATENHYGHTSTVVSRNRHGAVTEARDAVGHRVRTAYGALGRAYWQGDDAGGAKTTIYRDCSRVGCPSGAAYRVRVTAAGGAETLTYADLLGRTIRTATRMFDGVSWSVVDQEYDHLGRVVHTSEPFRSSVPDGGEPGYWTVTVYDDLGRPTQTTGPDNEVARVDYDGFTTTRTDPLGRTRIEVENARGN